MVGCLAIFCWRYSPGHSIIDTLSVHNQDCFLEILSNFAEGKSLIKIFGLSPHSKSTSVGWNGNGHLSPMPSWASTVSTAIRTWYSFDDCMTRWRRVLQIRSNTMNDQQTTRTTWTQTTKSGTPGMKLVVYSSLLQFGLCLSFSNPMSSFLSSFWARYKI